MAFSTKESTALGAYAHGLQLLSCVLLVCITYRHLFLPKCVLVAKECALFSRHVILLTCSGNINFTLEIKVIEECNFTLLQHRCLVLVLPQ
jgi:hypothetical protein